MKRVFVAGATGYTGRQVVRQLCERQTVEVIAHIRPGSSRLQECTQLFSEWGAKVDTTPFEEDALTQSFGRHRPDVVFALLGTTRARKKTSENPQKETYHHVDYKLTTMLITACVQNRLDSRFVYLSSMGVTPKSLFSYVRARHDTETFLKHSELDWVIARPGLISGSDRQESRPAERAAAIAAGIASKALGAVGASKLRDRVAPLDAETLASALILMGFDESSSRQTLEVDQIWDLATD